jgi:hypothetical protein
MVGRRLPRLVFVLDENAVLPLPGVFLSDPVFGERQRAFRERVLDAGITVQRVDSPDRLETLLFQALTTLQQAEGGRGGRIRGRWRGWCRRRAGGAGGDHQPVRVLAGPNATFMESARAPAATRKPMAERAARSGAGRGVRGGLRGSGGVARVRRGGAEAVEHDG